MYIVKQSKGVSLFDIEPGAWRGVIMDEKRMANMTCPNGHTASLSGHEIAADGTVTPSVVCPSGGCGFHEYVRLQGWEA